MISACLHSQQLRLNISAIAAKCHNLSMYPVLFWAKTLNLRIKIFVILIYCSSSHDLYFTFLETQFWLIKNYISSLQRKRYSFMTVQFSGARSTKRINTTRKILDLFQLGSFFFNSYNIEWHTNKTWYYAVDMKEKIYIQ